MNWTFLWLSVALLVLPIISTAEAIATELPPSIANRPYYAYFLRARDVVARFLHESLGSSFSFARL